ERVDGNEIAARGDGELLRVGNRRELIAVVDRLFELVERARELTLVPVDVGELVVRVAVNLVVRRRVLGDFRIGSDGQIPLRRITLHFVEEELSEGEVGVGDVLRLRRL